MATTKKCASCASRATHLVPLAEGGHEALCDDHVVAKYGPLPEFVIVRPEPPLPII